MLYFRFCVHLRTGILKKPRIQLRKLRMQVGKGRLQPQPCTLAPHIIEQKWWYQCYLLPHNLFHHNLVVTNRDRVVVVNTNKQTDAELPWSANPTAASVSTAQNTLMISIMYLHVRPRAGSTNRYSLEQWFLCFHHLLVTTWVLKNLNWEKDVYLRSN